MKIKLLTHAVMFLLFLAYLSSCKKEEVKPIVEETVVTAPNAPKEIEVSYRIFATSGYFTLTYIAPDTTGEKLVRHNLTINRMVHSLAFDWKSGNKFKVEATNVSPSTKEVTVEIYINGILYSSGLTNSPNGVASAEAVVY